jgi:hypothetical protein
VLALIGDVAGAYLELRERDLELDITRRSVAARRQSLAIVRDRFDAGLTSPLDLRQAEADLASTEAQLPDLERGVAETEHRLSILLGRNPGEIERGKELAEQVFPPAVPAGLPSALLERRPDIRLHAFRGRLLHVRHVLEVVPALLYAGGAAEVVDRDRRHAALGEAERELLVEAVQPANVRQDDDAAVARLVRRREERGEACPVRRLEHEVVVRDGRARDRRDRRERIELEAHRATIVSPVHL